MLEGIICQALLPKAGGKGRAMAMEILIPNSAIRNLIREDKVHQIYGMMQAGQAKHGMQTFNQSLAALYFKRMITLETALARSSYPDELQEIINRGPASSNPGARPRRGGASTMPSFVWKGVPAPVRSRRDSSWPTRATPRSAVLRRQQIQITSLREKGREIKLIPRIPRGIGAKRIAIFTRQFSVMLDAGLPLVQCLEILGDQEENRTFQTIIQQVRSDVESGVLARRRHAQAPQGLRQPVHQHGGRRRGGRYPRHHPAAPLDLHREGGQAQAARSSRR